VTRSGQAENPSKGRFRKKNAPPRDEPWIWLTREMLESTAWRALPTAARRIVERVLIEHMAHAGTQNGDLPVTYDDFVAHGTRRSSIKAAISIAERLGWVDVVIPGVRGHGVARRATTYGLTWLPRADWTPASNRWRRITDADAAAILEESAQSQKRNDLVTESGLNKAGTLRAVTR
jgi:hypothetical protein